MKHIIRDYLSFNKRERNGVFVLVAIITVLLIWLNVSENFHEKPGKDLDQLVKSMDSLNALPVADNAAAEKDETEDFSAQKKLPAMPSERFEFDPNNLAVEDWKRLGLSEKQIKTIKNYESKGGKFRKKEDLKKMYCIREQEYLQLEPYIRIPALQAAVEVAKSESKETKSTAEAHTPNVIVELNGADSAALTTIKGIGPFYAKTIIKYRNSLGGFYSKEQLMEVWKFDREKFDIVEMHVRVDPAAVKKININVCTAEELKGPYLGWNAANAIINYRKQHGKFKNIEDIRLTDLVNEETLRKIAPYLTIGDL